MIATESDLSDHHANVRGEELIAKSIADVLRPLQKPGIVGEINVKVCVNNGIISRVDAAGGQSHRNESR